MGRRYTVLTLVLLILVVLCLDVRAAYWNERIYNKSGVGVYDLTIILRGRKTVGSMAWGGFNNFRTWRGTYRNQPVTFCRWWNHSSIYIPPGGWVHIGIGSKQCCAERIKDAYWTDLNGNRVPGSVVYKASKNKTFCKRQQKAVVYWKNEVESEPEAPARDIVLDDLRYMVFDEYVPYEDLTLEWEYNDSLEVLWPDSVVLAPGEVYTTEIPEPVDEGKWIVLRFDNRAYDVGLSPGTEVIDWMEFKTESAVEGEYVNKEIYNLGPDAWDLSGLLFPEVDILDHYDNGFNEFGWGVAPGYTEITWWDTPDSIPPGDQTQIGWVANAAHGISDMWWTDDLGMRISNSVIYCVTAEKRFAAPTFSVVFKNMNDPPPPYPLAEIVVEDLRYAVLDGKSGGLLPKDLNTENFILEELLMESGAGPYFIAAGDSEEFVIPEPVYEGNVVILRYDTYAAPGPPYADTQARDFLQFFAGGLGAVDRPDPGMPLCFGLSGTNPGPGNPTATIRYRIPDPLHVTITVYDVQGRSIETLVDGAREAGYHKMDWDVSSLPSGVYFCRMTAGSYISTLKIVVLK
jgi:hypothetical protein